jgi:glycogen debranching enzyme
VLEDRIILKEGQVFVVSDLRGDIARRNALGHGLYRSDTRFLSTYELRLNGQSPILLSSSVDRAYVATFQLVNPRLEGEAPIPQQCLSLRRTRFLHHGFHERIGVQNSSRFPASFQLELAFDADFLDIFEVRGFKPEPRGTRQPVKRTETGLLYRYLGHDQLIRETEIIFRPTPVISRGRATFNVQLEPHETRIILIDIIPRKGHEEPDPEFDFDSSLASLEHSYAAWNGACTSYKYDNTHLTQGLVWRSQEDLRILCDDLPTGLFPTAGVPWYAVPFGRDALITAIQTLALNPDLAGGTLRYLARHQGKKVDPYTEEEPGRIHHEMRFGELANLKLIPHTPYYGTVDATPLFLVLLVELIDWTGDLGILAELWPNVVAALEWISTYGDSDGDGFLEHADSARSWLRNQGWKDSGDSLLQPDGQQVEQPAALVEVQGYVYQALAGLGRILRREGRTSEAQHLEEKAAALRRDFNRCYWMPEEGYLAQALDRHKRSVEMVSSNAGHALWSGVLDPRRSRSVVRRLVAPDMFSGWGIRTLSSTAVSYNPMSYHNGSIWPHDNSIIAAGMRRYGFREEPELVARSILEACMRFGDLRPPELFCGFSRDTKFGSPPGEYLVSCSPQAWAAGALFHFLQILVGVEVRSLEGKLRIDPVETCLYRRLRVEGMRVADGLLDFTVENTRSGVRVKVDRKPKSLELELPG